MNDQKNCPKCGAQLPADAPEGLCPACLMAGGFPSEPADPAATETMAKGTSPDTGAAEITPEIKRMFPALEILECLGQGGMGVVYKARQKQLDRLVALKVMKPHAAKDPAFGERFTREARALAKLNHPNIVSVYDFGEVEDGFYLIMEFMDGANLRQVIRSGAMKPPEALEIVPRICEALQFAHDQGVVHRDIKPENILLDRNGVVKIADFGLAKLIRRGEQDFTLTQAGMTMGTPRYMAPEQMDKPQDVDHRADIYSLGVVLYEMLTGEVPMGRFAPPSKKVEVDVRLDEIVLRALEREPELRFQQASEVKTQLDSLSGMFDSLPAPMRDALGWEYKSETTLWGWPLLHVTSGIDPKTGERRKAKGIVAVGEHATGLVAFGAFARGLFAFGAVGIGIFADAGLALGLFSLGGVALGVIASYGGLAAAPISLGGVSFGYQSLGGLAFGKHAMGGNAKDQAALDFFAPIGPFWWHIMVGAMLLVGFAVIAPILVHAWARRRTRSSSGKADTEATSAVPADGPPRLSAKAIWGFLLGVGGFLSLIAIPLMIWQLAQDLGGDPGADGIPGVTVETVVPALLRLGLPCVIGGLAMTLLGGMAIHDIRHSGGRIVGRPLAVLDVLFFPLLIVCSTVFLATVFILRSFGGERASAWSLFPMLIGLGLAAFCGWKLITKTWQLANRPVSGDASSLDSN